MSCSNWKKLIDHQQNFRVITLQDIVEIFFHLHDPTTLNRQGNDIGTQYRSVILYSTDKQKKIAVQILSEYPNAVTEIKPLSVFYPAESYHMDYYRKNISQPYCRLVINPKLNTLREKYSDKLI